MYRLSRVVNAAMCSHCGRWFTVSRRPIMHQLTDLLVTLLSGCSHPDDILTPASCPTYQCHWRP